jgi:hypothetical protein
MVRLVPLAKRRHSHCPSRRNCSSGRAGRRKANQAVSSNQ